MGVISVQLNFQLTEITATGTAYINKHLHHKVLSITQKLKSSQCVWLF